MERLNRLVNDTRGFTLIEVTLVLSIVLVLTTMMIPFGTKWIQETSEREAIDLLVATIYNIQSYSIAHGVYTRLYFIKEDDATSYKVEVQEGQVFGEYELPKGMRLSDSNRLNVIEFHENGDMIRTGVLTLVTDTRRFAITFQFQRGRMIITESERVFLDGSDVNNNRFVHNFQYTATHCNANYIEFG